MIDNKANSHRPGNKLHPLKGLILKIPTTRITKKSPALLQGTSLVVAILPI